MFIVLSSWHSHCESSPGSFDECRMAPTQDQARRLRLWVRLYTVYRLPESTPTIAIRNYVVYLNLTVFTKLRSNNYSVHREFCNKLELITCNFWTLRGMTAKHMQQIKLSLYSSVMITTVIWLLLLSKNHLYRIWSNDMLVTVLLTKPRVYIMWELRKLSLYISVHCGNSKLICHTLLELISELEARCVSGNRQCSVVVDICVFFV